MDIVFNLNSGLSFSSTGDFKIAPSNRQELSLLIHENLGSLRNNLRLGVGINKYINTTNLRNIKGIIFVQADLAGNDVDDITVEDSQINIMGPE
jgi:hypothetical protein